METGKKYISGEERKMTRLMLFIVSMRVSLVRVCLGGNLGTMSFYNPHTWILLLLTIRGVSRLQSLRSPSTHFVLKQGFKHTAWRSPANCECYSMNITMCLPVFHIVLRELTTSLWTHVSRVYLESAHQCPLHFKISLIFHWRIIAYSIELVSGKHQREYLLKTTL